jgi:hypothetical protein
LNPFGCFSARYSFRIFQISEAGVPHEKDSEHETGIRDRAYARVLQAVADEKPETLEQYFSRRDTPSPNSPTGNTIRRILAKFPEMSFDDARAKANEPLREAAGRRRYQAPTVLSADEQRTRLERLNKRFKPPVLPISSTASNDDSHECVTNLIRSSQGLEKPPGGNLRFSNLSQSRQVRMLKGEESE